MDIPLGETPNTSSTEVHTPPATGSQPDDSAIIEPIQRISVSPVTCPSSNRASPHQTPVAVFTDVTSNCPAQSENLPQFSTELTNLLVLSNKSAKPQNVPQTLPSFSVLQPQYAPVPDDTTQISPTKSDAIANQAAMLGCNDLPLPLSDSSKSLTINRLADFQRYNHDGQMLPSTFLDEFNDFPFRMDELYKASPSADSGYSPSQSTSSGLTPQYFLNSNHSFDPSSLMMTSTPRESTETPTTRLPSFSDVCSSYSGSIYSVDSGHPNDSPTQLLSFNDAASQYSVTSPCSGNPSSSPLQMHHLNDATTFDYTGSPLLTDGDISLDLDHFIDAGPSFSSPSCMRNSGLDVFNDTTSGCFTSYENLLKASEMPLKLPQVTDADLKQTLPPTNDMEAGASLSLDDAYNITAVTYSMHCNTTVSRCLDRSAEELQAQPNELVEITKVMSAMSNPISRSWKNSSNLSAPMQFPSVEKPIISIYPIPSTIHRCAANKQQISPAAKQMIVPKSLSIEAIPLLKELDGRHLVDTSHTLKPDFEIRLVNMHEEAPQPTVTVGASPPPSDHPNMPKPSPPTKMSKPRKQAKNKQERKKLVHQSASPTSDIHPIKNLPPPSNQESTVPAELLATTTSPFTVATTIQSIEFSSNQQSTTAADHPPLQWETNSGKLQLLSKTLPRCQVILERLDIVNSGCTQDLITVQNTIPKQYTIKRIKNRRFNKGTVDLQLADEKIQATCALMCEHCQMVLTTVSDLLSHYQDAHKTKGFVRCCKKKYYHRRPLLEHIKNHGVLEFR